MRTLRATSAEVSRRAPPSGHHDEVIRSSRAAGAALALAAAGLWGAVYVLAGQDVPVLPPAVELGGPPVAPNGPSDVVPDGAGDDVPETDEAGSPDAGGSVEESTPTSPVAAPAEQDVDRSPVVAGDRIERPMIVAPAPVRIVAEDEPAPVPTSPDRSAPSVPVPAVPDPTPPEADEPRTEQPSTDGPSSDEPSTEQPRTEQPSSDGPRTDPAPGDRPAPGEHRDDAGPRGNDGGAGEGVGPDRTRTLPDAARAGLDRAAEVTAGTPASPPPAPQGEGTGGRRDEAPPARELEAVRDPDGDEDDDRSGREGRSPRQRGRGASGAGRG